MMRVRASGCTVACLARGLWCRTKTGGAWLMITLKAATCSSTFAHAHKGRGMCCSSTQKSAGPAGRRPLREARAAPDRAPAVLLSSLADWPRSAVRFPIKCSNHELSHALLARARESFELCSHFKSLPPVSDRELSADLTWRARRRKPEFPALGSGTQSRCVQGDRGVLNASAGRVLYSGP